MAAVENQSLLPEVVEKIALFLPLPDVAKCMRVCRQWKVSHLTILLLFILGYGFFRSNIDIFLCPLSGLSKFEA